MNPLQSEGEVHLELNEVDVSLLWTCGRFAAPLYWTVGKDFERIKHETGPQRNYAQIFPKASYNTSCKTHPAYKKQTNK